MATFQKVKLGAVTTNITDGKHGDCTSEHNSGYYFISSKDVFGGSIHYDNARQITESEFLDTHRRTKLETGDILITNSGTIGRMALIKNDIKVKKTTFQKSVAVIKPNQNNVDSTFLYYKLLSLYKQLVNLGGGSAQHNLLLGDLRNFTIQIPDYSTQTCIASVLSAYDNLIENNEKRIKALEEMAQLLYTEWFASPSVTNELPDGWRIGKVSDIANVISGFPFKGSSYQESGKYKIVTIKNVHDGQFVLNFDSFIDELPAKLPTACILKSGDILLSLTGNVGRICVVYGANHVLNQRVAKLDPISANNREYLYLLFRQRRFQQKLVSMSNGAAQQNLSPIQVKDIPIVIPNSDILDKFSQIAGKYFDLSLSLQEENHNLSQTRDLLIPQLVTGKREVR